MENRTISDLIGAVLFIFTTKRQLYKSLLVSIL